VTGGDTGTDPGQPGAGVVGDPERQAAEFDDASSLRPGQADLASPPIPSRLPDQPEQPNQPDRPPEVTEVPDAASAAEAPPAVDATPASQPAPVGDAAPPTQPTAPTQSAPAEDATPPTQPALTEQAPAEPSRLDDDAAAGSLPVRELAGILTALSALGGRVDDLASAAEELSRLRSRDTDLIARLHEDVTRLRTGEIAIALNPVVTGMIKLHDQMVSLGALDEPTSPVGMLRTQLLQIMELTCAVKPFTPAPGERFDASRHTGTRRIPTTDASADGTIASTIKAGFARADGSVVRVAEVEVHRLSG
jgi:hypothetical protein